MTVHENTSYVTVYLGPFDSKNMDISPATQNINIIFSKDNETINIQYSIIPYVNKTYKLEFSTDGLTAGYYSFEARATLGTLVSTVKGDFELSWIDQTNYLTTQLRYMMFDVWGMHHLDVWDEGQYWNDMQLRRSLNQALSSFNTYGGKDREVTLNTASDDYREIILMGAVASALSMRGIYEISETHTYSDEITFQINRDYTSIAALWQTKFLDALNQIGLARAMPRSLKSPMMYNEISRHILALPPYASSYWGGY